jgi:hypothetical protein
LGAEVSANLRLVVRGFLLTLSQSQRRWLREQLGRIVHTVEPSCLLVENFFDVTVDSSIAPDPFYDNTVSWLLLARWTRKRSPSCIPGRLFDNPTSGFFWVALGALKLRYVTKIHRMLE